ncbi:MAG TPA: hypothetical protein VFL27_00355 [Candidatus Dormibacteraeota bacterium]|nr:hypothetical protein [Candidatus Dormibacteraeota bacterium]
MRLLRVGFLTLLLAVLLTAAVIGDYGRDRQVIRWFPGTGIAAKVDVWGATPTRVRIVSMDTGAVSYAGVWPDGTFIAPLPPGTYRLNVPSDSRTATLTVPAGECLDVILDFRVPGLVLTVPA